MTSRKPSQRQPKGPLRKGWTTGACATAAATAAYQALLTGSFPDPVTITLPKGQEPSFKLIRADLGDGRATAAVVKDAGDDPDVTHGAQIIVTVALTGEGRGISFHAGEGVGTVTRPGLALDVGEPAINPGPRAMMEGVIRGLAREYGCPGDVAITVAVPGGKRLAQKTLNGRLGIKGGGCSGLSYSLGFTEQQEGDTVIDFEDFKVFLDRKSTIYLKGIVLDFKEGLQGKGFVFTNPNASSTCGCGESFSV